ncbi:class I SAM-dependent methyltransferase [Cytobacillus sp. Hm23]
MFDYYGELCTKVYESDKSFSEGKELEFYLSFVKDKSMKVLEPMCGNGRMLIPFMQKGIDIEGFDISEDMLRVCKEKGEQLNLKPFVFHDKIEEFKGDKQYDMIMIPFGSFSLLPDSLVKDSLQNMKSVLNENGKLLLTIMTKNSEIEEFHEWIETNRKHFKNETIVENRKAYYDKENKLLNIKLKYQSVQDGQIEKTEIMDFSIRLYELEGFRNTLKSYGFQNIVIHDIKDGYGKGSSFQVFECTI